MFEAPSQVAALMSTFDRPWFIAGGWALDLFLGRLTRPHEDIEIAILRDDQFALRISLAAWEFDVADPPASGGLRAWAEGERLAMPLHELHARRANGNPPQLEILLEESAGELWRYRRNPAITRPLATIGLHWAGVPHLAPEIVLLYKAKHYREKDAMDFDNVRHALDSEQRRWLKRAIEVCHPGHGWLTSIDRFLAAAIAHNTAIKFINHPDGQHAFDIFDDDERSRSIVRRTLAFLQEHLLTGEG